MKRLNDIFQWLSIIGFLMVISAIPFGWSVYQRISCIVMLTGYGLYLIFNQQWKAWRWDSTKWFYLVMIALWAMIPLRQLFDATPPTSYYWHQLHCHDWFLFVGLVGLAGATKKLRVWHVTATMIATSLFLLAYCLFLYFGTTEYNDTTPLFRFNFLRQMHINSHLIVNLYINTALILGFCTLRSLPKWWHKALLLFAMALIWGMVLLSDGRVGIVSSLIVVTVCAIYFVAQKSKTWAIGIGCAIILAAGAILMHNSLLAEKSLSSDPRLAAWDFSVRMAEEKPVFGYGLSTLSNEYVERAYGDSVMYHGFVEKAIQPVPLFSMQGITINTHHPHNAFLMYWLAVGIPGVLLLIALFVLAAYMPVGEKNRLFLWLFLLILFLQCMAEPIGAHLHPQFIAMILFAWEKSTQTQRISS